MCGISGVISEDKIKDDYVAYLISLQKRRGPDYSNNYTDNYISLGHNRLSIQDINNNASQPYTYKNLIMVYNGEIYNYKDLKEELIREKNEIFLTNSDTELLIKLFYYYEKDVVLNKLEGMFAIGLYDKDKKVLTLIRDRFGEKPLHFYNSNKLFIFASMPAPIAKVLNKYENKIFNLDYECLNHYLLSGTFIKGKTLFSEILSLEPSEILEMNMDNKSYTRRLWWKPDLSDNIEYNLNDIKNILKKSVEDCEIGDRPGMLLFSGGNDSGVISLFLKNFDYLTLCNGEEKNSKSFLLDQHKKDKINYINSEFLIENAENIFQRHCDIINFSGLLCRSSYPVILTCLYLEKYKPEEKIILTGNGGDELFYGYYHMSSNKKSIEGHIEVLYSYNKCWDTTNKELKDHKSNFMNNLIQSVKDIYKIPDNFIEDNYGRWLELNHYLVGDLNIDSDITFMYSSIECRTPYLNSKLVEMLLKMKPNNFFYTDDEIQEYTKNLDYRDLSESNKIYLDFTNKSKKPLKEILINEEI